MNPLKNDWKEVLDEEFNKTYYLELREFLKKEYTYETVYPPMDDIYNALHCIPYEDVKAVIIGQDPYHGAGQAHGLSFSVQPGVKVPPSLKNIYKELHEDLGHPVPEHGFLQKWAEEGVLLLNNVLTVRAGKPQSHKGQGWEKLTDKVIKKLNEREQPVVFILWGKHAQVKGELVTNSHHCIIQSPHPSPFSARRGFIGSRPFSRTNEFLRKTGQTEVDWQLPVTVE
ncbi:uracil-DNA glycosylase [Salipaludibacillus aurantiacus]|uniref:Uracil-DNA glycosylase n=1 Tax=Salipaludibacillus aurantiacus TaxID=1601833 RepID=A0A1H9VAB4_9BACI|nr:uracil-DNA glycosylase [Salipaludibacillus aurantiacus]SES18529.1 uracil-DNA glycosylase [Salipaludibacillus aurantiacus]